MTDPADRIDDQTRENNARVRDNAKIERLIEIFHNRMQEIAR